MPDTSLHARLSSLCRNDVEFIVVGGLAALLNGAPIYSYDLDVVYSQDPRNIERILKWIEEVDAIFRIQPARRLRPNETHLRAGGHLNLLTCYGQVDLLARVGRNLSFADLFPHSNEMEFAERAGIRVLNLEKIIEIKEQLGTDKDKAALPILRQTLRELKSRNQRG